MTFFSLVCHKFWPNREGREVRREGGKEGERKQSLADGLSSPQPWDALRVSDLLKGGRTRIRTQDSLIPRTPVWFSAGLSRKAPDGPVSQMES